MLSKLLANLALAIAFTGSFIWFVSYWAGMPIVQISYSQGHCVKVIEFTDEKQYSCENLPPKYEHEWVH